MSAGEAVCANQRRLKISWSALQTWWLCQHKSNLMERKLKSPTTDIRNFFHGTVCDRIMRAILSSPNPDPSAMPDMVDEFIEKCLQEAKDTGDGVVRWRNASDRAKMTDHCKLVLRGLAPQLEKLVLPYDYEPEFRFRVPIRIPWLDGKTMVEVELRGGIDILVRRSNVPLVFRGYDLKATLNPDYLRKTLGQAVFYDLAILGMFGVSPEDFAFLQPGVESNPYAQVTISHEDRVVMLNSIRDFAHGKWRGDDDFTTESGACYNCPVKGPCKKYKIGSGAVFAPVRGSRSSG